MHRPNSEACLDNEQSESLATMVFQTTVLFIALFVVLTYVEIVNIVDGLIDGFTRPVKREKIDWHYLFLEVVLSIGNCFYKAWYYEYDDSDDLYCQTWGRE